MSINSKYFNGTTITRFADVTQCLQLFVFFKQTKRHHFSDVTSYIGDFQNGGQISCSLRCKGCQFSECLDSSFAFFNKAELLKNNMEIFAIRFSRKKFQKHHMRQRKVQYVAQYPDGTSIRTLETKTQFLRRPFQFSVNEVLRMKAEHFSFKMKVLAI